MIQGMSIGETTSYENPPLVTIIIPLYNKTDVIQRAINSVIQQTYKRWRLIIVDDGSTDDGITKLSQYENNSSIKYIQQSNQGPGAARNKGLSLTHTPFVTFLDADDEWIPSFLEKTMTVLLSDEEVSAVSSGWTRRSKGQNSVQILEARNFTPHSWSFKDSIEPHALKDHIDSLHSSATVARTNKIKELGGYYDKNRCTYGEDSYLWGRLIFSGSKIYYLPEPLLEFHTDASSLSEGRTTPYPLPPLLEEGTLVISQVGDSHKESVQNYLIWYNGVVLKRAIRQKSLKTSMKATASFIRLSVRKRLTRASSSKRK